MRVVPDTWTTGPARINSPQLTWTVPVLLNVDVIVVVPVMPLGSAPLMIQPALFNVPPPRTSLHWIKNVPAARLLTTLVGPRYSSAGVFQFV